MTSSGKILESPQSTTRSPISYRRQVVDLCISLAELLLWRGC